MSDTGTWHLAPLTNTLGSDLMGPSCTSVNLSCLRELQFQVFRLLNICKLQTESYRISFFHQTRLFNVGFCNKLRRFGSELQVSSFSGWDIQAALSTASARSTRILFWITTCQQCSLVGSKHRCITNLPKSSLLLPHLQVLVTFHWSVTLRTEEIPCDLFRR